MASPSQSVLFLHGIGAGPESWDAQIDALPSEFSGFAPRVAGLTGDGSADFSLTDAAGDVAAELDRRGIERAHICGLSLGAMIAIRFAIDYPNRVSSLVLSGAQVRPNPALMALQSAIMRVLPSRLVAPPGMSKPRMRAVLRSIARADLREELSRITAPTLVLCGLRDRPNLPAARELAAGITDAKLQLVPDAGHEWNISRPEAFSKRLNAFYAHQTEGRAFQ
ncbi:alpha/beta fold hydrolase [Leucobacter sp. L43]|uniref:alpha/beta fold hydrolase n=1 Tax=Leucobacter sp. L43 TaxID=2798040 RepID=UPI001908D1CF|nr:alpha/beta hydrolase [Leucobacter sp. L43]